MYEGVTKIDLSMEDWNVSVCCNAPKKELDSSTGVIHNDACVGSQNAKGIDHPLNRQMNFFILPYQTPHSLNI